MTKLAFKDMNSDVLKQKGKYYANEVIPSFLRPNAMQKIRWHQAQGDTVVIVSASLDIYLKPWCDIHGLQLICTELEIKKGIVTGNTLQGDCSSTEKARRIKSVFDLSNYDIVYAYGDTIEDNEMLALATPKNRFYRYF